MRELRQGGLEDAEVQPPQAGPVPLLGLSACGLEGAQEVVQESGRAEEGREGELSGGRRAARKRERVREEVARMVSTERVRSSSK